MRSKRRWPILFPASATPAQFPPTKVVGTSLPPAYHGQKRGPQLCVCSRSPLTAVRQTAPAACRYDLDLERNAADPIALAMTSSVQPLSSQTRGENHPGYNPKLLIANCSTEKGTMQKSDPISFENVTSA